MAKRVVDRNAPWGRLEGIFLGVDVASFRRTVKECPTRNALRMKIWYFGSLRVISLYRSP
jgi:hypothetical protein